MEIIINKSGLLRISDFGELDLDKTFNCGQCFRWHRQPDGGYRGVAEGRSLHVAQGAEGLELDCAAADFKEYWHDYFDLDLDYEAIRRQVAICEFMEEAADFGRGIRILRQDPWEAMCSFIISQCNNIRRIQGIVEKMAGCFGKKVEQVSAFPTASQIAGLSLDELAPLRSGYRAKYILSAARAVDSGAFDLEAIKRMDTESALKNLTKLEGIGIKVASCVLLFGYHKLDAFPVDVWMKRAIDRYLPNDFSPKAFGAYAGIAQQYIFNYVRNGIPSDVNHKSITA